MQNPASIVREVYQIYISKRVSVASNTKELKTPPANSVATRT